METKIVCLQFSLENLFTGIFSTVIGTPGLITLSLIFFKFTPKTAAQVENLRDGQVQNGEIDLVVLETKLEPNVTF